MFSGLFKAVVIVLVALAVYDYFVSPLVGKVPKLY